MASLRTATPIDGGQSVFRIFKIPTCVTGDTVYVSGAVRGWILNNLTTADAVTATFSTTTNLFTITVANTPDIHLFVIS